MNRLSDCPRPPGSPRRVRLAAACGFVATLFASVPAGAVAPELLVETQLRYDVYRGGSQLGEGRITLQRAEGPDCWFYSMQAKPRGWVSVLSGDLLEQSNVCVADGKLRSVAYRYSRDGLGGSSESYSVRFDWPNMQAVYQNGKTRPLEPGMLDRLSIQLGLRDWLLSARAATGKEPTDEHSVVFPDKKRVQKYRFQVKAHEKVTTPAGTFETTRLDRTDKPNKRSQFWLDPTRGYIVVKAEQQSDDDPVLRLMLKELPKVGAAASAAAPAPGAAPAATSAAPVAPGP